MNAVVYTLTVFDYMGIHGKGAKRVHVAHPIKMSAVAGGVFRAAMVKKDLFPNGGR